MAETDGIVGYGGYTYKVVADWAKLPADWLGIPMPSLPKGIDTQGHVTVTIDWPE